MTNVTLDKAAQVCYNGGMETKQCICGCGEQTKGGDFRPGHDARYKSALITSAMLGNEEATAELDKRGWTKFLEKRINVGAKKERAARVKDSDEQGGDGLPINASRPEDYTDTDEFVRDICSGRMVVIRRTLTSVGIEYEEQVRFRDPFHRAEKSPDGKTYKMVEIRPSKPVLSDGVLRLREEDTGGCRSIRLADVVGVLNR